MLGICKYNAVSAGLAKDLAKSPYAWPGGYPKYAITDDGAALCHKCARSEFVSIASAYPGDGWNIVALDVNWEDSALYCDHCGELIESAYGE